MEPKHYACEMSWTWGGRMATFRETSRFTVYTLDELDAAIKAEIARICERYAFDCGRLTHPLNPSIGSLHITPVYTSEWRDLSEYRPVVAACIDSVKAQILAKEEGRRTPGPGV